MGGKFSAVVKGKKGNSGWEAVRGGGRGDRRKKESGGRGLAEVAGGIARLMEL